MGDTSALKPIATVAGLLLLATVMFLMLGTQGNWDFVLAFRGAKLLAIVTVGTAISLSTILLQTLSANRILTPSIMGFDALFLLLQALLLVSLGGIGFSHLNPILRFCAESFLLTVSALVLFRTVLGNATDLSRLLLTGLILGVLFRSLTSLISRLIDPSEFAILQGQSFASFNGIDDRLIPLATGVTAVVAFWIWRQHHRLDVLALGRDVSINLGVEHAKLTRNLLAAISVLVAVSTALVGPIVFFGLLVSALTYRLAGSWRHQNLLPFSCLVSALLLVFGQTLFEHLLNLKSSVAIVLEGLGGLVFLALLFLKAKQ